MKPSEILARVRAKKTAAPAPAVAKAPRKARRVKAVDDDIPLDSAWVAQQPRDPDADLINEWRPEDDEPGGAARKAARIKAAQAARANGHSRAEPVQHVTVAQLKAHDTALFDAFGWAIGCMAAELNRGQPSQAHVIDMLNRSASTPERRKLFNDICQFKEETVRGRTREEFLRYQNTGRWT
jgi:hypothetical protein